MLNATAKVLKRPILLFITCFSFFEIKAQTFEWWRDNVMWDGVTQWYEYLIVSPAFFGPNALPVPAINNGNIDSVIAFGATGNFHFSPGDKTQNLTLYANYSTPDKTVSFDGQFIPYERFSMTHATKEKRRVYYKEYYARSTVGDVIMNTTFRLLKKYSKRFQLALRLGVRFPSGERNGAARYTDGPGYWMDAGYSKPIGNTNWKLSGMAGFYAWQTNSDVLRQNDALLFGVGAEWNKAGNKLQVYTAGYLGYKDNGDKPVVLRVNFEKKKNRFIYLFRFQQGLRDFDYATAEAGLKYIIIR